MASVQTSAPLSYAAVGECHRPRTMDVVHETAPPGPPKPRLLDRVREALRTRHYSRRTEEAYVAWIRRYILFHGKRHPGEMGAPEITRFLTALAVDRKVAASTQNQALGALLFLYRDVLDLDVPWLDGLVRAKRPQRLPVVLTRDEVRAVLQRLNGAPRLMAYLLVTMLPAAVKAELARHLELFRSSIGATLSTGRAGSSSPPPWRGSTRMRAESGRGTGSSRPLESMSIGSPASGAGTTSTNPSCNAP